MKLKISGGDIVNPAGEQFGKLDILIEDGKKESFQEDS